MLVLLMDEIYEASVEIGSRTMMHKPSFIKIGSGIKRQLREHIQIDRKHIDLISLILFVLFFQNMESMQKI
jgi:hypothetical protein